MRDGFGSQASGPPSTTGKAGTREAAQTKGRKHAPPTATPTAPRPTTARAPPLNKRRRREARADREDDGGAPHQ